MSQEKGKMLLLGNPKKGHKLLTISRKFLDQINGNLTACTWAG